MKSALSVVVAITLACLASARYTTYPLTQNSAHHDSAVNGYTDLYSITPTYSYDINIRILRTTTFSYTNSYTLICPLGYGVSPSSTYCYYWTSGSSTNNTLTVRNAVAGRTYYFGISTYSSEGYSYDITWCPTYGCSSKCPGDDCSGHGGCTSYSYSTGTCWCDYNWYGYTCSDPTHSNTSVAGWLIAVIVIAVFLTILIPIVLGVLRWASRSMNGGYGRAVPYPTAIVSNSVPYQQVPPAPQYSYTAGVGPNGVATAPPPYAFSGPVASAPAMPPTYSTPAGNMAYGATYTPH